MSQLTNGKTNFIKIVMTHYPPCDALLTKTEITQLYDEYGIDHAVFGHLHNLKSNPKQKLFGTLNGIEYHLTSCDYLDFTPKPILEL